MISTTCDDGPALTICSEQWSLEATGRAPRCDYKVLAHCRRRRGQSILFYLQHGGFASPCFTQNASRRYHGLLKRSRDDLSNSGYRRGAQTASETSRGTQGRSRCRLRGVRTTQTDRRPEMGCRLLRLCCVQGTVVIDTSSRSS